MKNLNTLLDQWIGEEKNITGLKKSIVKDFDVVIDAYQNFGYNQVLKDLKSRKQELIEGIEDLVQNYLDKHCIDEIGARSLLED